MILQLDLNIFGNKQPIEESEEPEEPKNPVTAKGWRESAISLFTLPSGVVIKLRSLNKDTFRLCMPWLISDDDESKKRSVDEVSIELQAIIVPRHVIEPRVVLTQEEEDNDPDSIYIENIPLIDRFTIATYIIRQDEFIHNAEETKARKAALKSFQQS